MNIEKLNKCSFVIYSIIIGSAICSLILNIEIFTVVLKIEDPIFFLPVFPPYTPIITHITHLSLDVYVFFVIIIISCLEIFLNLIIRHRNLKYCLIGISSIISISLCLMILIDPKLLVLNQGVYQPFLRNGYTVYYHNISIGGIIAIILSSLLIVKSIITIFNDLRNQTLKKIDEPEVYVYHSFSKSRLICPHCRSAVELEDYYCSFCSGIVYVYIHKSTEHSLVQDG